MSDFYNPDRRTEIEHRNLAAANGAQRGWGWLWALIVVAFFAAIIVAGHNGNETAQNPPAANNPQAAGTPPPAATPLASRPAAPRSTTGQGGSQQ
jgi:hypothetical protein